MLQKSLAVLLGLSVGVTGCGDDGTLGSYENPLNLPPGPGSVVVAVSTEGLDLDDDGYQVTLDAGTTKSVTPSGTVTFDPVDVGNHVVSLAGIASNCAVSPSREIDITVEAEAASELAFVVSCDAVPVSLSFLSSPTDIEMGLIMDGVPVISVVDVRGDPVSSHEYEITVEAQNDSGETVWSDVVHTVAGQVQGVPFKAFAVGSHRLLASAPHLAPDTSAAFDVIYPPIAFSSNRSPSGNHDLYSLAGTSVIRLTDAETGSNYNAHWSPSSQELVYRNSWENFLYTIESDGSNNTLISSTLSDDYSPQWSPDGNRIVYASTRRSGLVSQRDLYIMNANGSGDVQLTNDSADDISPAWSPDGSRIAWRSNRDGSWAIWLMSYDGSNATKVVSLTSAVGGRIAWSPDGEKLLFATLAGDQPDVFVVRADGANLTNLTNSPEWDEQPDWSPDGQRIVFSRHRFDNNIDLYVMDADGSNELRLTSHEAEDNCPTWRP